MSVVTENWRNEEPSLEEVIQNHKDISRFVILKTDIQRRGIKFTKAAKEAVNLETDAVVQSAIFSEIEARNPVGLTLRDGTSVVFFDIGEGFLHREPYWVDVVDGKTVITDQGKVIEEVSYWPNANYYDVKTSAGTPMWRILNARPQRMDISPNRSCHFWDKPGNGCKYCPIGALSKNLSKQERLYITDAKEIGEAVGEAIKQKGRFTQIVLTAGSILSGKELLDDEVDMYINILKEVGKNFTTKKFPSQLIGTAYNDRQLQRLWDETGLTSYTTDIEVLNEEIFNKLCPGKAEFIGYKEWKRRLVKAVEIFGKGNVSTGLVSGVELAEPYGFKSEEEALKNVLEEAETLISQGVAVANCVWMPAPGTMLYKSSNPSLEYYISLSEGIDKLHRKYDLTFDFDDYRRCGNHPATDLRRI